jgi:membrane fusion protein (multidrug efflux system)
MTPGRKMLIPFVVITALAVSGVVFFHFEKTSSAQASDPASTAPDSESSTDNAVTPVQTVPLRTGDISETRDVYGSVSPEPGATAGVSVAVDVQVVRIRVVAGQSVAKATPLIDVEATADVKLQFQDARDAMNAAAKTLADVQQRYDLKLATNSDLLGAQQTAHSAEEKLSNFEKRGIGDGIKTISATADSLVVKIDAQPGQLITAGTPFVELLPTGGISVRLGIEPADATNLKVGDSISLYVDNSATALPAKIHAVSEQIDPDTRLVDVYASPNSPTPLLLGEFVKGQIALQQARALIVPRRAVLPDDQGFTLFTVVDGKAQKHAVTLGPQSDSESAVIGDGLHENDAVVVQGNLELDDGDAVSVENGK